MGSHFVGLTCFHVREGEPFVKEIACGLCGEICNVKRDVEGATSWAMAMGQHKVKHDFFSCPNVDKEWHVQALDIFHELTRTKSPTLKRILEKDMEEVIKNKKVTL